MTEKTNSELNSIINEMTAKVIKVAETIDKVLPESGLSEGVKDCAAKLQQHVQTLAIRASGVEIIDDIDQKDKIEVLKELAAKDCIATFKLIDAMRTNSAESPTELTVKTLEVLSAHARELYIGVVKM